MLSAPWYDENHHSWFIGQSDKSTFSFSVLKWKVLKTQSRISPSRRLMYKTWTHLMFYSPLWDHTGLCCEKWEQCERQARTCVGRESNPIWCESTGAPSLMMSASPGGFERQERMDAEGRSWQTAVKKNHNKCECETVRAGSVYTCACACSLEVYVLTRVGDPTSAPSARLYSRYS